MATPQLSPGVLVREVDLTVGRADNVLDNIGGIAGPFAQGPVDEVVDITTEQELINVFGKPYSQDNQYEYWMSASSFLSYGGVLKVVRTGDDPSTGFKNASAIRNASGVSIGSTGNLQILNFDNYEDLHADDAADYIFASKNPGSWANNLKVCVIDDKADQILTATGIAATTVTVGLAVTTTLTNEVFAGSGSTSTFTGYLKGIVTGVGTETGSGENTIDVKIVSRVATDGTETLVDYKQRDQLTSFRPGNTVTVVNTAGAAVTSVTLGSDATVSKDWYDTQVLDLDNQDILWSSIAPKPTSNQYATDRNGRNDAIHVVVVDDLGTITGTQSTILEKLLFLSKARDSVSTVESPIKNWWKDYLARYSNFVYVGDNPSDNLNVNETVFATGFTGPLGNGNFTALGDGATGGLWNIDAQDKTYSAIGNVTYNLTGGLDYNGTADLTVDDSLEASLGNLMTSYDLMKNTDEVQVDYLIMGPGSNKNKFESQAKANKLISIAGQRKDCVAVISPHRLDVVGLTDRDAQTDNIIEFFSPLQSSSYAIFDSGYKYTYDRFNNKFRYIPCNADVAGLCVRTSIFAYPWFSPAGQQRGILNNAIKLAYNPSKAQRDQLYPQRVNSIVNKPGIGILLFGDKTGLGYASAFDRINVRRLFLTVEQALARTAEAQLFELNDEITRANFVNIVEPYLRDVQAKRGLYGFLVVCDETNNTPDIIDNNEFRADIFLKPAKSINYVTLTFVATRTGVAFEEVVGTV